MKLRCTMLGVAVLLGMMSIGCGSGSSGGNQTPPPPTVAAPTVSTSAAQNGAVIATLATTTAGATIYYTMDGSAPTTASQIYQAPFLVSSNLTVKSVASSAGTLSTVTSQSFSPGIASGTLVWSDEFSNSTGANAQPSPQVWTYDTGLNCCGNNEKETYCAWGSTTAPCDTSNPNVYADTAGILHIVGRAPSAGVYTSGRIKTQGLFSFQYGRIEARMKLPESQGMWPAFWLLGNNIVTLSWPACGELDVMEHINGSNPAPYQGGTPPGYDWIAGSVHGGPSGSAEINGSLTFHTPTFSAAGWHTYGMIWSKGQIQFYVDDPANIYATFTPTNGAFTASTWPFDAGPQFVILNLAVGGDWPGAPDATTVFPSEIQVDYVRIYTN